MKNILPKVHFMDLKLLTATNPIEVILIGAGGTGTKVLLALADMNHSLNELGHAGFTVNLWDFDTVEQANLGRQRFAESELGLNKAVALINRCNRFFGTDWKAVKRKFQRNNDGMLSAEMRASIYITCVDNVASRFEVAEILESYKGGSLHRTEPKYWMDFGNSRYSGQVILSTVGNIKQPESKKFEPQGKLPFITEEFGDLLQQSEINDNTPSCSLAEALEQQDLFINATLADMGCSLLWNLFRNGYTASRGIFLNLATFKSESLPVC